MLEHNANLTHLSMMPQKTPVEKSTVHCFVSKLKSLVDLRINGEFEVSHHSICFNRFNLNLNHVR